MSGAIARLAELLRKAGAVVTLDPDRNITHPCFCCGTTDAPRDLVRVGTWSRKVGVRGDAGDPIERPLCAACVAACPESPMQAHNG